MAQTALINLANKAKNYFNRPLKSQNPDFHYGYLYIEYYYFHQQYQYIFKIARSSSHKYIFFCYKVLEELYFKLMAVTQNLYLI